MLHCLFPGNRALDFAREKGPCHKKPGQRMLPCLREDEKVVTVQAMQGKTPTLARRYLFKLLANIASVPVYLIMEAILPRALGPRLYGEYSFATNLFYQLSGFLDMGTSTCLYNSLSRRQTEGSLIAFYMRVSALVFGITMAVALFLFSCPTVGNALMPDVPLWLTPFAALWAFLTWWGRVLRSMNDAIGATVPSEIVRSTISLAAVGFLVLLFVCDVLNIATLFVQQYLMLGLTALGYWLVTVRCGRGCWENGGNLVLSLSRERRSAYTKEFFDYSNPLFVQALLAFLMIACERWLLQFFNGSTEQGFFALSQKVGMACFLFVSAMTPLLMRELSIAWGKKDVVAMGRLVDRFAPLLYVVAAYFSCFTLVEAAAVVELFGGAEFAAAVLPVQIMALYPLHQAYGQLASSIDSACAIHIVRAWPWRNRPCPENRPCPDSHGQPLSLSGLTLRAPFLCKERFPPDMEPCCPAWPCPCKPQADHGTGNRRSAILCALPCFRRALHGPCRWPCPGLPCLSGLYEAGSV